MKSRLRPHRARRAPAPLGSAPPWGDVLAAFNDAVIVMDDARRIVLFNPAAEELTGQPQRRVLGEPCDVVFGETPLITEMVMRVQAQAQSESRSEERLMRGRRSIPVRITCLPLWDVADRVSGTALVIHDLGYQKTLEETARRNESLARLGTMVAGLAHEVRNPLAGIKGAAQLLEARLARAAGARRVHRRDQPRGQPPLRTGRGPARRSARRPSRAWRRSTSTASSSRSSRVIGPDCARAGIRLQFGFDPSLPDVLGR